MVAVGDADDRTAAERSIRPVRRRARRAAGRDPRTSIRHVNHVLGVSARSLVTSARHRQLTRELRRDRSGIRTRAGQRWGWQRSSVNLRRPGRRARHTLCRSGRVSAPPFVTHPYATQPYATALCTASPSCGSVWAQRPANTTGAGPGAWRAGTLKCTGACASDAGGGGAGTGSGVRGCAAGAAAADGAAGLGGRSA